MEKSHEVAQGAQAVDEHQDKYWAFHNEDGDLCITDRWDVAKHIPFDVITLVERAALATQPAAGEPKWSCLNAWFLSLEAGRQAVLREDKWMLAGAAFDAGRQCSAPPAAAHGASDFFIDFDKLRKALSVYGLAAPVSNEELGLQMERQAIRVIEAVAKMPFPTTAAAHGDGLSFRTVDELAEAIRQVSAYEDLGPELIAEEMFKQAGSAEAAHGDEGVREDAERWRYGAEHGFPDAMRQIHPVEGPVYWVRDWQQGGEQFETAEAAIDAARRAQGDGGEV